MSETSEKIITYMKSHWPSIVKEEWQVHQEDYPAIIKKIIADWTVNASQNHELVRIAGLSGSGKTTQLLPAVQNYFDSKHSRPILVAARRFVEYHPFVNEIKKEYGEANLRKMTDEFATITMFLTMIKLVEAGYDIILDVTLLDPEIEKTLTTALKNNHYKIWMTMIAVSPVITEKFLGGRAWRHSKETEQEFIRVTNSALEFYANSLPEMRIILWNVWDANPIYDGPVKNSLPKWNEYSNIEDYTAILSENDLRDSKTRYLSV